jgi:hypothetical protein
MDLGAALATTGDGEGEVPLQLRNKERLQWH